MMMPREQGAGSGSLRGALRALLAVAVALMGAATAGAQVGYPPGASPYRDLPREAGPVLTGGYYFGVPGKAEVGITDAVTLGARYDLPLGGVMRIGLGASYGVGERFVQDPTKNAATRKSGPFSDHFLLVEGDVQLLLTGHKTWRGFAPYVGGSAGILLGGAEPGGDTTYALGTPFVFAPVTGMRWYPARRLSVQLDARLVFLRLRYPAEYFTPGPDGSTVLPQNEEFREWTRIPWLRVGVGWTF